MKMAKSAKPSSDSPILSVWRRELGQLSSRNFVSRIAASEDVVLRLDVQRKLPLLRQWDHVISVCFNESGDILVSCSSDMKIKLWDWESGRVKHSFHSGYSYKYHVLKAKMMPYSEDRIIVTCAYNGQVKCSEIRESGVETKLLFDGDRAVPYGLAIEPGSPHIFYTCSMDGVQHFDLRTQRSTKLFSCESVASNVAFRHSVSLNAITIDPRNPNLVATGGGDPFARVYDICKYKRNESSEYGQPANLYCPRHIVNQRNFITALAYSCQSELLASYSNESMYLFTKDVGLGPISSQDSSSIINVENSIKAASQSYQGNLNRHILYSMKEVDFFGPNCEYVVTGTDIGKICIWNKKDGKLIRVIRAEKDKVSSVQRHPHATVLASCGRGIKIWVPIAIEKAIPLTNEDRDRIVNLTRRIVKERCYSDDDPEYNDGYDKDDVDDEDDDDVEDVDDEDDVDDVDDEDDN